MDVAASEFYKEGKYDLDFKNPSSDASQVQCPQLFSAATLANTAAHLYPHFASVFALAVILQHKTGAELAELYASFTRNYPVVSIEDPFDQDDWESYTKLTEALGKVSK
jgi:enolase